MNGIMFVGRLCIAVALASPYLFVYTEELAGSLIV
jgi:hypothetical protein